MLDTILIAMSGMNAHQKGLRTISDNVANMNTPGFKGSQAQFIDIFKAESGDLTSESYTDMLPGGGVDTQGAAIDFSSGEIRNTGRSLDTAINGSGFFVLRDASGHLYYTKSGRFQFDGNGRLVTSNQNYDVMGLDGSQSLTSITNVGLNTDPPSATHNVKLTGNLTTQEDNHTISSIKVYDAQGAQHILTMTLKRKDTITTTDWLVTIKEGDTTLLDGGTYSVLPTGPDPTASDVQVDLTSHDGAVSTVKFTLGADVTSYSAGSSSSLAVATIDGYGLGTSDQVSFDENGLMNVTYSNGQTRKGQRLAIAEFAQVSDLKEVSGTLFDAPAGTDLTYTTPGIGSTIQSSSLELSNVDLTNQFGELVLIQRGYQASSQVMTTANDMIQQLLDMKGKR